MIPIRYWSILIIILLLPTHTAYTQAVRKLTFQKDKPSDHWFISIEGGGSLGLGLSPELSPLSDHLSPMAKLSFGKQLTPIFTMRGQIAGWQLRSTDPTLLYTTAGIDFMSDLTNLWGSYNPKKLFHLSPFVGIEAIYSYNQLQKWNFGVKGGVQFLFRVSPIVNLYLEATGHLWPATLSDATSHPVKGVVALTAGISFNIGKSSFTPSEVMDYGYIRELNYRIDQLKNRKCPEPEPCPKLENNPERECPECPKCPETKEPTRQSPKPKEQIAMSQLTSEDFLPEVIHFGFKRTTIETDQQATLARQVAYYLKAYPDQKIRIVGYADMATGNPSVNLAVSAQRAKNVARFLVERYGIEPERLLLDWNGDRIQPFEENSWNRAVVFIKIR